MRFVLDASIVITWALRDEDHPLADLAFLELRSGSTIVPRIWWYEIRNVLVLNERRKRISPDDSNRFLLALELLSITVDASTGGTQVVDMARNYKLSVYDAAYLALALRERLPLATLDKALRDAAVAAGVSLLA